LTVAILYFGFPNAVWKGLHGRVAISPENTMSYSWDTRIRKTYTRADTIKALEYGIAEKNINSIYGEEQFCSFPAPSRNS
jgi:hypothetical protein